MKTFFVILSFFTFSLFGNTQISYDSLFVLNLKMEIKGMSIDEGNKLWFYTYHQVHEFDIINNSDNVYPVADDTVYQYLFDNALKNSDYETVISPNGESVIYLVDRRNIFWFIRKENKYVLFKHLEIKDQFTSDYSKALFIDDDKIITGGRNGFLVAYTKMSNELIEDTISLGESAAIYSMGVSKSGDTLISLGTGGSSFITYSLSADSVLNNVSLDKFQKYCDGYWCTQIPIKIEFYPNDQKLVAMIANKVNSIIESHATGRFSPVFYTQEFNALDFSLSRDHLFVLDEENIIYIMDSHQLVNKLEPGTNRYNPYQKIIVSKDESFLIRYTHYGHIEVYEKH